MTIDITPEAVDLLAYRCNEMGYKECAAALAPFMKGGE